MTVGELMSQLQTMRNDARIFIDTENYGPLRAKGLEVDEDGDLIISA